MYIIISSERLKKMKKVTKAVIPAAGLGTRMLPIARAVPKEALPIVDRPAISYLVEEAKCSGITDVLIITGRNKDCIEDYFDFSPEYEQKISAKGGDITLLRDSAFADMNIYFLRQKQTKGLGHAVGCAKAFVGDEPFAVLYGDDIIFSEKPVTLQLIEVYEKYGKGCAGVKEVPSELVRKYCTLKTEKIAGTKNEFLVSDMIEKPGENDPVYSNYSILGRVVLPPEIFDIIENTPPGAGGEIQLTDAMKVLSNVKGMTAVDFEGERYDLGSKLGFMKANVVKALEHAEIGEEFKKYIKELAKTL